MKDSPFATALLRKREASTGQVAMGKIRNCEIRNTPRQRCLICPGMRNTPDASKNFLLDGRPNALALLEAAPRACQIARAQDGRGDETRIAWVDLDAASSFQAWRYPRRPARISDPLFQAFGNDVPEPFTSIYCASPRPRDRPHQWRQLYLLGYRHELGRQTRCAHRMSPRRRRWLSTTASAPSRAARRAVGSRRAWARTSPPCSDASTQVASHPTSASWCNSPPSRWV